MHTVSVIGATGYAGAELVRLLSAHPHVRIAHLVSRSYAGRPLQEVYPSFAGNALPVLEELDPSRVCADSDVVFTALPHKTSAQIVPLLVERGARVIDLSGDFRYNDAAVYEKWYGSVHPRPDLLEKSVYGLTELHRDEIRTAGIIGTPGCFTTCGILALAPAVKAGLIDTGRIIIDAKTGASGAGASPSRELHFCEVDENVRAYKVAAHRHTSEIEQELSLVAGKPLELSFTPHLVPLKRGILSTIHCELARPLLHGDVMAVYREFYGGAPFIVLHQEGSLPEVKYACGGNACHIGWVVDRRLGG
jgi:N-acetyl-gamma-glutamyl-phosphate reductase